MKLPAIICAALLSIAPSSAAWADDAPSHRLTSWDKVLDPIFNVFKSEWWYTVGFLSGKNQNGAERRFGFMVSVVRSATLYFPVVFPKTDLQISLLDLDARVHYTSNEPAGFPASGSFDVTARGNAGHYAKRGDIAPDGSLMARFVGAGDDFAIDFTQRPAKTQALFGDEGVVDNGSLGKAVYVSRTRQQVIRPSTVVLHDETIEVTGVSWEDHQLTDLHPFRAPIKWNWFAILLNDGTELMAYQIVDAKSEELLKNYVGRVLPSGEVENLDGQLVVAETAHALYSDVSVPTAWDIAVPAVFSASISHTVPLPDVPMTAGQVKGAYFEGPCDVTNDGGKVAEIWAEHFNGQLYDGTAAPRL